MAMSKKLRAKGGSYRNTYDGGTDRRGFYMIQEDMSEPSNAPRENKSIMYPYVECGGVYANDSVNLSDKDSSEMASKMRSQLIKDSIF